jgi:hypothetical protein
MNNYTLDPSKQESAGISPPAPSAPASAPAPNPAAPPFYMPHNYPYPYYPYQYPQATLPAPASAPVVPSADVSKINDWLAWSIINLFVGGLFPGLIPLIFSLVCRSRKKKNNVSGAKTMSTWALVFNIMVTVIAVATAIGLFIYLFVYTQQMGSEYLRKI